MRSASQCSAQVLPRPAEESTSIHPARHFPSPPPCLPSCFPPPQLLSRSPVNGGFLSGGGRVRIVDAPIQLTHDEVSMIAEKQYRVRESMRVN